MLVSRSAGRSVPLTRSSSPSMLFKWMPVPGTITPELEPSEQVREAAFPHESTTEMWVVPVGRPGSGSPGADQRTRATASRTESSESNLAASPPR